MTTELGFAPEDFPSVALAYERVKESAQYQAGLFDALDSKLVYCLSINMTIRQ
jgi:hypothetical protein